MPVAVVSDPATATRVERMPIRMKVIRAEAQHQDKATPTTVRPAANRTIRMAMLRMVLVDHHSVVVVTLDRRLDIRVRIRVVFRASDKTTTMVAAMMLMVRMAVALD